MSQPAPEFSRPVKLAHLRSEPFVQQIEATADERHRLAQRFDLIALDHLTGTVTLQREGEGRILLEGSFDAEFTQTCVVTLEPVPGRISRSFSMVYVSIEDRRTEIELDADEPVFEPLTGDEIDIGEAVAQELSLSLPDFPRDPEAVIDSAATAEIAAGPFAALPQLIRHQQN